MSTTLHLSDQQNQLAVEESLDGLNASLLAVKRKLDQSATRLSQVKNVASCLMDQLAQISTLLPQLRKHLANQNAAYNITSAQLKAVLTGLVKRLSDLESFAEDLLAGSDAHARPFERNVLLGCEETLERHRALVDAFHMPLLLLIQLLSASPTEPRSTIERRQNSLDQRIVDILAADSDLSMRLGKDSPSSPDAQSLTRISRTFSAGTFRSGYSNVSPTSPSSITEGKLGWMALLSRTWSRRDKPRYSSSSSSDASIKLRPLSVSASSSSSSVSTKGTLDTSLTSIDEAPATPPNHLSLKVPISPKELANGHHYLEAARARSDSKVDDVPTINTPPKLVCDPFSPESQPQQQYVQRPRVRIQVPPESPPGQRPSGRLYGNTLHVPNRQSQYRYPFQRPRYATSPGKPKFIPSSSTIASLERIMGARPSAVS